METTPDVPVAAGSAAGPGRLRGRRAWLASAACGPLGWGALHLAAMRPEWTETLYAARVYPVLQGGLARIAARLPLSLGEVLVAAALLLVLRVAWRDARALRRGERSLASTGIAWVWRSAGLAGAGYLLFLLVWGFNHARPSYAALRELDDTPASRAELLETGADMARRAGELRARLAEDAQGVFRPRSGRLSLLRRVPAAFERVAGLEPLLARGRVVVRPALCSSLMSAAGLTGIYFPFTGEAHVNARAPAPFLGFSACHEAAHASGFAREDEASFLAWLACDASGDEELRYSGTLGALSSIVVALRSADEADAVELLTLAGPAVGRDLDAAVAFWRSRVGVLGEVARLANDGYLRSSGRSAGTASYGRDVELLVAWRRQGAPGSVGRR